MRLLSFAVLLALCGCSQQERLERFASKEEQASAKARIEQLRAGDFDGIEKDLDSSLKGPGVRATLQQMSRGIPTGTPTSITLVGATTVNEADHTSRNITFEYDFAGQWFLINVATNEKAGATSLTGLNVRPIAQSLEEQNRFTLEAKSAKHYAVLGSAIVAAALSLYALVACIRTPMPRRKWLWILFILFGIGKLGINWTTGDLLFAPASVQLFSASAAAAFYGPFIVSVSLPLGAMIFLIRYRMRRAQPPAGSP